MARFGLSKIQVAAILDMRLHQLTGLAIEDLQKEYDELMKLIEYLRSLLASRELRLGVIKDELADVRNRYADPRRTEITYDEGDINYADLIPRHSWRHHRFPIPATSNVFRRTPTARSIAAASASSVWKRRTRITLSICSMRTATT